jgi:type IV secretory pathway VirB10-like protein
MIEIKKIWNDCLDEDFSEMGDPRRWSFGGGGGKSAPPPPPPPPPPPTVEDPAVKEASDEQRRRIRLASTNENTILTSTEGDTTNPNLKKKTLLGE